MSCDKHCFDESDPEYGREECFGCSGADAGPTYKIRVSEEADGSVCRWEFGLSDDLTFGGTRTMCGVHRPYVSKLDKYRFCPYCGKEILYADRKSESGRR